MTTFLILITYTWILQSSENRHVNRDIFLMMVNKGCVPNENTYTILVGGLAFEEEETDIAADLLKELCGKEVLSQSTVERLCMQFNFKELIATEFSQLVCP
ncbi:hypothetical protein ACSQ67_010088 [Phaseolus vulgaris]